MVWKEYINMDREFFDENLMLLLFQLLKFRKLRKSKCKKIYIRRRPPKFWVQNIFNYNLQQNLRFPQYSSRYYLPRRKKPPEVFLEIPQNSQENNCARVSRASGLQLYLKRDSGGCFSRVFLFIPFCYLVVQHWKFFYCLRKLFFLIYAKRHSLY